MILGKNTNSEDLLKTKIEKNTMLFINDITYPEKYLLLKFLKQCLLLVKQRATRGDTPMKTKKRLIELTLETWLIMRILKNFVKIINLFIAK